MPRAAYESRLADRRAAETATRRREALWSHVRLATFLSAAVVCYLLLDAGRIAWLPLPIGLFAGAVVVHGTWRERSTRAARAVAYYQRRLAATSGDGDAFGTGKELPVPVGDHPYAEHLDVDALYARISEARSAAGRRTLASWLLAPAEPDEIRARQEAVDEWRERIDLREELATIDDALAGAVDDEALPSWGERERGPFDDRHGPRAILAGLTAATLVLLGLGLWIPFLAAAAAQGLYALRFRRLVREVVKETHAITGELALLARLLARLEAEQPACERLRRLRARFALDGRPASERIERFLKTADRHDWRGNQFFAPLALLVAWSTHHAFALDAWRRRCGPHLRDWAGAAGEFEALLDLAGYAFESPDDPFPEVADEAPRLVAEGLAHPLLSGAVRNDLRLDDTLRLVLVTGSNMSGKSTLLRAVGVNVVLAQAGAPVRARSLVLSPLAVAASIRTVDSLASGASRFFAEITAIRKVVDLTGGARTVLFLLDELLHGTNSHDRRAGGIAVVKRLVERGAVGLVTTHDLALTALADELGPAARNAHFDCRLENGALEFDYRLRPGVVEHSNALALMRAVGLDV